VNRTKTFRALALTLVAAATLTACSGSNSAGPDDSTPGKTDSTSVDSSVPAPPATAAPPGSSLPPGTAVVVQDDLSPSCTEAVDAIRAVMKKYKSGYEIRDAEGAEALTKAVNAATDQSKGNPPCGPEEWKRFNELEFRGWLAPAK
jgi:hypothetical protein